MNKSKSTKRKHNLRTLRRRYVRQFRGGAAATIAGSGHDNKIITTIIIAALFSGIYNQDERFMFKIAIEHILKGLTRDNLEYFRKLMNAPHEVVVKAVAYAHHKPPYTLAVEMNGGSRRRTKHRLHLRRKSHKYKLQSGGDRTAVVVMLFLFIMSCWFLFSEVMALTAPQLSNTLKDIPGVIKRNIPEIFYSDQGANAAYASNIEIINEALKILIAELSIGFSSPLSLSFRSPFLNSTSSNSTSSNWPIPANEFEEHFRITVNRSLTTPNCTAAMGAIVSSLDTIANIAVQHHHIPSVPISFKHIPFSSSQFDSIMAQDFESVIGTAAFVAKAALDPGTAALTAATHFKKKLYRTEPDPLTPTDTAVTHTADTAVTHGSTENERFMLTQGWARDALRKIFQDIIPKELTSQFSKSITDRAEPIILSACGAFGSVAFMFILLLRKMRRSRSDADYKERMLDLQLDDALAAMELSMTTNVGPKSLFTHRHQYAPVMTTNVGPNRYAPVAAALQVGEDGENDTEFWKTGNF